MNQTSKKPVVKKVQAGKAKLKTLPGTKPVKNLLHTIAIKEQIVKNTDHGSIKRGGGNWNTEKPSFTTEQINAMTSKNFRNILKVKEGRKTFNFLAQVNRGINRAHVQLIVQSIKRIGIQRAVMVVELSFITGIKQWYVIDGQHLMNACLCEGLDIPYTIMDGSCITNMKELITVIAMLNTSSKKWQTSDYITAWGVTEPQYLELRKLQGIYNLELDQLAHLLHYNTIPLAGGGHIYGIIKDGSFTITNAERAEIMLAYIKDAVNTVKIKDSEMRRRFISSYANVVQGSFHYDHQKFLLWLTEHRNKFTILDSVDVESISNMLKKVIK